MSEKPATAHRPCLGEVFADSEVAMHKANTLVGRLYQVVRAHKAS